MVSRGGARGGGRRLALAAALAAIAAAPAGAQDDEAPALEATSIQMRPGFAEAVEAIATGKEREGLAGLEKVLARFPDDPDRHSLHYNEACAYARLGELDPAFAQLEEAVTRGYGIHPLRLENLARDPDLDKLRGDPRYAAVLERARKQAEAIRDGWDRLVAPFVWTPPPPKDAEPKQPLPLLIVLHPFGAERESFARASFLPFCERHGFALLAPGAEQILAPGRFAWAATGADFVAEFRKQQRRIWTALEELRRTTAIDPQRIYVAGAGQGAALGFAVAVRNPQWVRGAVLFGGGYAPATLADWTERSAAHGRRIALVHGRQDEIVPFAPLSAFVQELQGKGLAVELVPVEGGHAFAAEQVGTMLESRIAWIDAAPAEPARGKSPAAPAQGR